MTELYEVGGRRLGVRWSRAGLDAELRTLARGALGIQEAPANLSIVLGESTGRTRSKHQLYVQGRLLSMTSGDGGLVRAVIRTLGALAADAPPGSLTLDALLLVDPDGAAVAVDRQLAGDVRVLDRHLRRGERRVLQPPRLAVWPERATAVLPDAVGTVGVPLAELNRRWPFEAGDDDLTAGAVEITRFVYAGRPKPESRADAMSDMLPMLRDRSGRVDRAHVAQLATLTDRVHLVGIPVGDRSQLTTLLGL